MNIPISLCPPPKLQFHLILSRRVTETALPQPNLLYRFDPFEVDVRAGQLRKHGLKLRLSGQPLEILIMLLENPGSVVTREEIQQRLWSAETFVDFENSLNKAINKLRQVLADSPDKPTYIETLPRRGYRFLVPVQRLETQPVPAELHSSASTAAPPQPLPQHVPAASKRLAIPLFICAAVVPLAILWFVVRPQPVPRVVKITPLSASSRVDVFGRLQSDGVRLFFLERRGHRWQLSQMPASGGAVEPFPTSLPNAKIFAISPEKSEFLLASFTERDRLLALWSMPSVGGTPRRLGDIMATDAVYTPDGARITFSTDEGIFEVGRDALNLQKLLVAPGPKQSLAWSPDGKELRFEWITTPGAGATLWSLRVGSQNPTQVLPAWKDAPAQCCGRFSPDGRYYIFVGFQANGTHAIYALREPRGIFSFRSRPFRLDTGPILLNDPIVSPDGHQLFALAYDGRNEYFRFDPETHDLRPLLGGESAAWLCVSLIADQAVFHGNDGNLYMSRANGTERHQLVAASLNPELPAISPDGKQVLFVATSSGSSVKKICLVSTEGGPVRDVISQPFSVYAPSWSPDGQKILYSADPNDAAHTGVYIFDLASRQSQKISGSEGFWKSRFSPDGKFIASVSGENKFVNLFNLSAQQWTTIARGNVFSPVAWSSDSRLVFYQDVLEDGEPVHRYNLQTRQTDVVMDCRPLLEGGVLRCGFEDLLSDGSLLLQLTRGDHTVYSLTLDLP